MYVYIYIYIYIYVFLEISSPQNTVEVVFHSACVIIRIDMVYGLLQDCALSPVLFALANEVRQMAARSRAGTRLCGNEVIHWHQYLMRKIATRSIHKLIISKSKFLVHYLTCLPGDSVPYD